jgi:Flp pilus assembly protein TadD
MKDFTESLTIRRDIGDKAGTGDVLIDLGNYYVDLGKPEEALKLYKESLQVQIDLGDDSKRGQLLNNIGNIYLGRGAYEDAHTYFEQALSIREKFNVSADLAETLHNLGETAANLGLYDQALAQYQRALDLQRKAGNKQIAAIETSSMGTVFGLQGRFGAALSAKEEALKTFVELGDKSFWRSEIQAGYGNALAQVNRTQDADKNLTEALALARELKNDDQIARILGYQGDAAFYRGDLKASHMLYLQAAQAAAHSSDRSVQLNGKFDLNRIAIDEGRGGDLAGVMASLADDARKAGLKYLSAMCSIYQAKALIEKKKPEPAKALLESTLNLADKMGLRSVKAQCHALLAKTFVMQGDGSGAASETALATRLLSDIQQEGHFDPKLRFDLALP